MDYLGPCAMPDEAMENAASATQLGAAQAGRGVHRINASSLFGSAREVIITHNGREYRLRITAQQKLILTA
jgi:hemin uptake protein HemP